MKIKKIAAHVVTHCTFCKAEGVRKVQAVWRITGNNATACDAHKPKLEELRIMLDARESTDYSEADYQTWLRQ